MKIIGFAHIDGKTEMVLKGDSSMLVNRKPFFVPEGTTDIRWTRCVVLRVSRLGKGIAPKFANRYWDAFAPGADFIAEDMLQAAKQTGSSWTSATCFDYSLAIGEWTEGTMADANYDVSDLVVTAEEAISQASKTMTIRQGDLIYISRKMDACPAKKEEIITETINGTEKLYCKIK